MLETRKICYDFRGELAVAAAGSGVGNPFVKAETSAAGAPTVGGLAGGGIRLQLAADVEVENLCLYMGDVLPFDIDDLVRVEFIAKVGATLGAAASLAFGLTSARNDAIDSITEAALFRAIGSDSIVVETDDGTNNNDDVATGAEIGTAWNRFAINFAERNTTQEPPSLSLGRKSNIGFYAGLATGNSVNQSLRRVASGTRFDMSNYAGGLQLFAQLQKTSDATAPALDILAIEVEATVSA